MSSPLPPNVHISQHPCVRAKLSQLRSHSTNTRETKSLIHEIALLVGCEALASSLDVTTGPKDQSPLGYEYTTESVAPTRISLVPVLRSGLGMLDGKTLPNPPHSSWTRANISTALQALLPNPVPIHHLGLYREKTTLQPVEYYNNLPYHRPSASNPDTAPGPSDLAIILDPVIATGATACAAIDTLKDWGVKRIVMISILCSEGGLRRAAEEWSEGVEIWVGGVDAECDERGMIKPGLGDVGDRLFLTIGK